MNHSHEDVLRFWFPAGAFSTEPAVVLPQLQWWFRGGADSEILERFPALLERAARGELDAWSRNAPSRLALVIVLDQFPRSIHRGTAAAYSTDAKALGLAREGIECGHLAALANPWEKMFLGLPLGHSEALADLELAVELMDRLVREGPQELRAVLEFSAEQTRGHRDVIARFGRQPHRNETLGRRSTPEELEYLASGQLVHTRPLPRVGEMR